MHKDYERDKEKNRKRKEFKLKSIEKKENNSQRNKLKQNLREYMTGNHDKNVFEDSDDFE
jgi:hypothetical protein